MHKFSKEVPFDPGYSNISFPFLETIDSVIQDYAKLKANHQKKFWLNSSEAQIVAFIRKSTAFYLGCLLWASFIHNRFKDKPKEISGNNISKISDEEFKDFDCAYEVKEILNYIKLLDRDCKYFLNRLAKIPTIIVEILENYVDFAELNNNFRKIKKTSDIKLPKFCDRFSKMTIAELDKLCEQIYSVIESSQIEGLYELI